MTYLIDTDWLINGLEGRKGYPERLRDLRASGIAVSSVSIAETLTGIIGEKDEIGRKQIFEKLLVNLTELPFDRQVVPAFALIRKRLLKKHAPLENFDIAIAATAISFNLTLLTDNKNHFERIEGLKVYRG